MNRWVQCLLFAGGTLAAALAIAGSEELLVTAHRTEKTVIPGASLRRPADFALQRIKISSDAPELAARKDDILGTLRLLQAAAAKGQGLELCVLLDGGVVVPLQAEDPHLRVAAGARPQTSELALAIKARTVSGAAGNARLFARLRDFPATVRPAGRAAIDMVGGTEVTVEDPLQYRSRVVELYAAEAKTVTAALGPDYRVVTRGIDRQLQWLRDGGANLVFFIPYEFDVIPANVSAYGGGRSP
ncbi:MAG: hypothetical protein RL026_2140 [Pseudomonadota bacterium]